MTRFYRPCRGGCNLRTKRHHQQYPGECIHRKRQMQPQGQQQGLRMSAERSKRRHETQAETEEMPTKQAAASQQRE